MADLTSGLVTRRDTATEPARLRIDWIGWTSPFRATDLAVGDVVTAIDGVPFDPNASGGALAKLAGQYGEAGGFAGRAAGDLLTLTVQRRDAGGGWRTLTAAAPLVEVVGWRDASNRPLVGPDGPIAMERDGFDSSWSSWLDALQAKLTYILDAERHTATFVNRVEARLLIETHGARVAHLVAHYPGAWGAAVKADYDRALASLQGERIALPPGALEFRRRGEILASEVGAKGRAAWAAAIAAAAPIPAFPAIDPTAGTVADVAGKAVVLPPLGNAQWVSDTGRGWFAAGSVADGWYFVDAESPAATAMLRARQRYVKIVDPALAATFEFLGVITGDSRLVMVGTRAHFGLLVTPVAALVGGAMFVDLTHATPEFAGEAGLIDDTPDLPADDATPAAVMTALVGAVKAGDLALWRALHVDWQVATATHEDGSPGRQIIYPHANPPNDDRFEDSRRSMAKRVADARVAWVGDVTVVADGTAWPGAPRIEAVAIKLEHIGDRDGDGDFRVFSDVTVSCDWQLQRLNGGPWRVATVQAI
jgi:hypothetical protein